jgi:hypothetical protein
MSRPVLGAHRSAIICKYEDVLWALRRPEDFSSEMDVQIALGTQRPVIRNRSTRAADQVPQILDLRFNRQRWRSRAARAATRASSSTRSS